MCTWNLITTDYDFSSHQRQRPGLAVAERGYAGLCVFVVSEIAPSPLGTFALVFGLDFSQRTAIVSWRDFEIINWCCKKNQIKINNFLQKITSFKTFQIHFSQRYSPGKSVCHPSDVIWKLSFISVFVSLHRTVQTSRSNPHSRVRKLCNTRWLDGWFPARNPAIEHFPERILKPAKLGCELWWHWFWFWN